MTLGQSHRGLIRHLDLHGTHHGSAGQPILILHGLLGSSRNWRSVAQSLADNHTVVTVDLRNHGQSPHSGQAGFAHMVADVCAYLRKHQLGPVHLLGHSLGGKVAMTLALRHPDLFRTLIVVDIAPVPYPDRYSDILRNLQSIRIEGTTSRAAVERKLAESISDTGLRHFLLMNLVATGSGFRWSANLDSLQQALPELASFPTFPPSARFRKPALYISGARSDYILEHHHAIVRKLFPAADFVTIDRAGHWPHVENTNDFLIAVNGFLNTAP